MNNNLPAWPANLEYTPNVDLFRVANMDVPPIGAQMQSGQVKQRPQFTLQIATIQWGRIFQNGLEMDTLHKFLYDELGRGLSLFTMPVWSPTQKGYVPRICQIVNGLNGIQQSPWTPEEETMVAWTMAVRGYR